MTMGSTEENDALRAQLDTFDDDGSAPRHVLHYAYPDEGNDLAARPAIVEAMKRRGFAVSDAVSNDGLVMEHHAAVAGEEFDSMTELLSAYFEERGWTYDGWECAVVTETLAGN